MQFNTKSQPHSSCNSIPCAVLPMRVESRKVVVKPGTESFQRVMLNSQRRQLRQEICEITKKPAQFEESDKQQSEGCCFTSSSCSLF